MLSLGDLSIFSAPLLAYWYDESPHADYRPSRLPCLFAEQRRPQSPGLVEQKYQRIWLRCTPPLVDKKAKIQIACGSARSCTSRSLRSGGGTKVGKEVGAHGTAGKIDRVQESRH